MMFTGRNLYVSIKLLNFSNNQNLFYAILIFTFCDSSFFNFEDQMYFHNNIMSNNYYFIIFNLNFDVSKEFDLMLFDNLIDSSIKFDSLIIFQKNKAMETNIFSFNNIFNERFIIYLDFLNSISFCNNKLTNENYYSKKNTIKINFIGSFLFFIKMLFLVFPIYPS